MCAFVESNADMNHEKNIRNSAISASGVLNNESTVKVYESTGLMDCEWANKPFAVRLGRRYSLRMRMGDFPWKGLSLPPRDAFR